MIETLLFILVALIVISIILYITANYIAPNIPGVDAKPVVALVALILIILFIYAIIQRGVFG